MLPTGWKPKSRTIRLTLPPLHAQQRLFVDDEHRVVVAACGTKTGKTFGLCIWLLRNAWNNYQSLNWWCAPTYKQADIAFKTMITWLPPSRVNINKTERLIELLRTDRTVHSRIQFRSAEDPASLRGEGVHAAVVDEAAYWNYESFVSVWTTLTRTNGKVRVISTPKGRNWFYEEWSKGETEEAREKNPGYISYQLPTSSNPFVSAEALVDAKLQMPEDVFRQEFLAEFLAEGAGVFHNLTACQDTELEEAPTTGHQYVMGIDWAKHEDYTVFTVMNRKTRRVVCIERHNDIDWNVNVDRAVRLAKYWNRAAVLMDSTGGSTGDVVLDAMKAVYPFTKGYQISNNAAKVQLIQKLQLAFERIDIHTPAGKGLPSELRRELERFSYTMSGQGKFLFSAPQGYHDDMVISLALAYWEADEDQLVYRARSVRGL